MEHIIFIITARPTLVVGHMHTDMFTVQCDPRSVNSPKHRRAPDTLTTVRVGAMVEPCRTPASRCYSNIVLDLSTRPLTPEAMAHSPSHYHSPGTEYNSEDILALIHDSMTDRAGPGGRRRRAQHHDVTSGSCPDATSYLAIYIMLHV